MGLRQSKDELLYQQVSHGNTEAVRKLRSEGAGLEWMDKEGKTPLILASMNPQLYDVAKTLIELGANVNAYRPGRQAGTPLHHAARSGLGQMVNLLLSRGANALVMNDDCQTALDVARVKGYSDAVRAIENHICLFSGWLQELYGPGILELLAPQLLSRKVPCRWVVIVPCGARKATKPLQVELAIYSGLQDAKPHTIIALWKASMDESNLNQPNPTVVISSSKIPKRWRRKRGILHSQVKQSRIKLAPVNENEKQQLMQFCNACKGIPQVIHPFNNQGSNVGPPAQTTPKEPELALPINASLQSGSEVGPTAPNNYTASRSTTSPGLTNLTTQNSETAGHNKKIQHEIHDVGTSSTTISYHPHSDTNIYSQVVPTAPINIDTPPMVPSAPLLPEMVDNGPVHYPSIDSTPIDPCEDKPGSLHPMWSHGWMHDMFE
ncbi:hypothetical protein L1987_03171 [Smallanthus sonchifolius]|uniref:Uncharacterized protein n=1 Tax=Smallanthus sonchifolius TaxID=185202 RepID=A0ACB9K9V9_9ASTR|nr:hypothetical protein L1987_03171 [Smallanthus sonchifolius]